MAALVVFSGALTGTAQASPAGPVDLGTLPGDDNSTVLAVNDAGVMVGLSLAGPTPQPDDGLGATVEGVDAHGTVVGSFQRQATVWYRNGERTQLGTLPGGNRSEAYRITDSGRVVGRAATAAGKDHAVYWTLS